MAFLHLQETEILIFLEKLMFLLSGKGIQKYLFILEMSNQGFLISVFLLMIYVFTGVRNTCHLCCPLTIAIAV